MAWVELSVTPDRPLVLAKQWVDDQLDDPENVARRNDQIAMERIMAAARMPGMGRRGR